MMFQSEFVTEILKEALCGLLNRVMELSLEEGAYRLHLVNGGQHHCGVLTTTTYAFTSASINLVT